MGIGEWVRENGSRAKGMDSALWLPQGERDCPDAAASKPPRPGANVFVRAVAALHCVCRRNSRNSGWYSL